MAKALSGNKVHVLHDSGPGGERMVMIRCIDVDENDTLDLSPWLQKATKVVAVFTAGAGPFNVTPASPSLVAVLGNGALLNDVAWIMALGISAVS